MVFPDGLNSHVTKSLGHVQTKVGMVSMLEVKGAGGCGYISLSAAGPHCIQQIARIFQDSYWSTRNRSRSTSGFFARG